ncbi:precorrin-6y C5,15-methyltransferase (decarboxylating) subunit CbiE [Amycolatopsis sp. MtRt-6]|uniref:precorrin-6y C5,15-methyltransferase (decarboxylating) subunit CbiE n=1 Tax=Amycolatopsis sp. MtRt-6 TaxID=2792782 RepID=UPI0027DC767A|nr:precorrin-6y C5,15-methyltransferase (decarboxylating) subunit CbiE [Amycolatopsis sp. MtRt-6]
MSTDPIDIVGIGADGWSGLSPAARSVVLGAEVVVGSERQLGLLPDEVPARRVRLPSPLRAGLPGLLAEHRTARLCVLASGDPMAHGIGVTIGDIAGPSRVRVVPHPSSIALACARLGWPSDDVEVVNVGGRPVERLVRALAPGRRLVVLGGAGQEIGALLVRHGYGASRMVMLEELGGPAETLTESTAAAWDAVPQSALHLFAVSCAVPAAGTALATVGGLPDTAFEHDGQLTKRDVRAAALARLAPQPGELLWDVGAGAGSIAIEWMRHHPSCRAIAVERDPARAERIGRNAGTLGVPDLEVVLGPAPDALAGLPGPAAVFVGGGVADPRILVAARQVLPPGGRLVAHAVTVEAEHLLAGLHREHGGELSRLAVDQAEPLGRYTAWRRMRVVTQWTFVRLS